MAVGLAKSIFEQKPDETRVVADVYATAKNKVVNSFQALNDTMGDVQENMGFLSQLASGDKIKMLEKVGDKLSLNKDGLIGKISSALSDSASRAKSLLSDLAAKKESVMAFYNDNVNKVTGVIKDAQSTYVQVQGAYQTVANADLTSLRGITSTMNALNSKLGMNIASDGPLSGIYSSLVQEASDLGIGNAFTVVADTIQQSEDIYNKGQAIYNIATDVLPNAIKSGNISLVSDIAGYLGTGSIPMMLPNTINSLAQYNEDGLQGRSYDDAFADTKARFDAIDPNWNRSTWQLQDESGSLSVYDTSAIAGGSSQIKDIFGVGAMRSDTMADKLFLIAKEIGVRIVDVEIGKRYPYSPAIGYGRTTSLVSDPRVT